MTTTNRNVRVDDDLWHAAKTAAAERGDNLSAVLRRALADYVAGEQPGYTAGRDAGRREILGSLAELGVTP